MTGEKPVARPCALGTGVDIVETRRMSQVLDRWGARFKDKVFLPAEQAYCESKAFPCRHYAGRFAVKEAVSKAFGTGVGPQLGWLDIEVVTDARTGAPTVCLSRKAQSVADARRAATVLVSLSHSDHYAIAHALLVAANDEA